MIVVGSVGNLLVIFVVARNPAMRTARNVFVVNLAVSDLMLCLITMPLTLIEILYLTWQFGNLEVRLWAHLGSLIMWPLYAKKTRLRAVVIIKVIENKILLYTTNDLTS